MVEFLKQIDIINSITKFIKIYCIIICTCHIAFKIINNKNYFNKFPKTIIFESMIIAIIHLIIQNTIDNFYGRIALILLLAIMLSKKLKNNIGYSILITIISLSISDILLFISAFISFIPKALLKVENSIIEMFFLLIIYVLIVQSFCKIKRLKNGLDFLQKDLKNEYFDILMLNISVIIVFSGLAISNYDKLRTDKLGFGLIIFAIVMFITIQKSLQLYYKQKLLVQELNETKEELENTKKDLKQVEEENLNFSKKSHTLAHKQKSLEYKLQQLTAKAEITTEEAGEVKDRLKEIEKDLYKDAETVELNKTGILEIDDMLEYMQSECKKNKIDFDLQISGNIYHMTNNLINKEDLEILLADHIKDAIIAINHSDNVNRSILVRLGEIDGIYSLYIYDSGIEFEKDTLENLGKKPITTHSDEGGTGMGFMNTFDTLRKYEASLIINEMSKPNKDNYTKAIIIKFDKKNEFKIISYRQEERKDI